MLQVGFDADIQQKGSRHCGNLHGMPCSSGLRSGLRSSLRLPLQNCVQSMPQRCQVSLQHTQSWLKTCLLAAVRFMYSLPGEKSERLDGLDMSQQQCNSLPLVFKAGKL